MKPPSLLSQSLSILHSFFSAVILFLCVELLSRTSFLTQNAFTVLIEQLAHIIFRILVYSAVYGSLIELLSGEQIVISLKGIFHNAKKYWYVYAILEFFVFSIYLSLFSYFPNSKPIAPYVPIHVDLLLQYIFAYTLIHKKYLTPFNIKTKSPFLPLQHIATIIGFFVCFVVFHHIFIPVFEEDSLIMRAGLFCSKYLQLLLFTIISTCLIEGYRIKEKFAHEKEIYFIIPPGGTGLLQKAYYLLSRPYPTIFLILRALSPKNYHYRDFYQVVWRDRYYAPNKLIAISCVTQTTPEVYEIAKSFKERGSTVILGGLHVSIFPEEALEYCDSVVVGEAESIWPEVIRDYENGCLKEKYVSTVLEDMPSVIHQEMVHAPPEQIKSCLETSRGCKFHCEFCSIPTFNHGRIRQKPVSEIVELLQQVKKKYRFVNIRDANMYADPKYFKALCSALKPLKIAWEGFASIDIGSNEDALRLAKESGCKNLGLGLEIIADSPEKKQGGKFAMSEKYLFLTQKIKNAGIRIKVNFTFGFESDTFNIHSLFKLWKFCYTMRPYQIGLGILTPFPGTQMYARMLKENRLTTLNWHSYSILRLVFKHKSINKLFIENFLPFVTLFFFLTVTQAGLITVGILILIFIL